MKIELNIKNSENLKKTPEQWSEYVEIFEALIQSGGLDGVKGGKTIIHFDGDGTFMAVQLDYMPWKRKRKVL